MITNLIINKTKNASVRFFIYMSSMGSFTIVNIYLPIITESTNLGGGSGAEASYRTIFKMLIYLWNIL